MKNLTSNHSKQYENTAQLTWTGQHHLSPPPNQSTSSRSGLLSSFLLKLEMNSGSVAMNIFIVQTNFWKFLNLHQKLQQRTLAKSASFIQTRIEDYFCVRKLNRLDVYFLILYCVLSERWNERLKNTYKLLTKSKKRKVFEVQGNVEILW